MTDPIPYYYDGTDEGRLHPSAMISVFLPDSCPCFQLNDSCTLEHALLSVFVCQDAHEGTWSLI